MNERIRELAEQAYTEQNPELLTNASRTFEHGIWLEGYSKKFAELIVKECVRIDKENPDATPGVEIARYFGVEE